MSNQYPKKAIAAGEVKISENVIRSIASDAAPVSVSVVNDLVEITLRLVLVSGYRLTTVAEQVQQNVKESVQSMTGVIVSKVHVIAADIMFDD